MGDTFQVPRDEQELYIRYASFVARLLRKYNVIPSDFDDIQGDIWVRLVSAGGVGVLKKFKQSACQATFTGAEAAAYLGVPFPTFKVAIWRGVRNNKGRKTVGMMPKPLSGGFGAKSAVYSYEDIEALDASNYFRKHPEPRVAAKLGDVTKGQFEAYLTLSVRRHFANWLRTKSRKDRDMYLAPFEDGTSWESHVADTECTGVDEVTDRNMTLGRLRDAIGEEKMVNVLDMMRQGYTLSEVATKLQISTRTFQAVRHG